MITTTTVRNLLLGILLISSSLMAKAENYTWKTVRVGGGGATTTIQAHPKVPNLYFITTDVGTPYRWNNTQQRWEGMFYNATNWTNRSAAARIAFDPSDTTGNILYATTGGPWSVDGTILKSTNRGYTWTDCNILLDIKPNSEQGAGQRLAVDPQNGNVVYVTTKSSASVTATNGTFKSINAGGNWTKINDLYGSFVQFDASAGVVSGVTKNIYIGCSNGVYRSTDGGANFALMSGSPAGATKASLHSSGVLYVTATSGVYKWNGTAWSNITPPTTGGYTAVAVNPNNVSQVVVSSSSWSPYVFNHYRSSDGGSSWTLMNKGVDKSEVPWFATSIGQATGTMCWDPYNQNKVWFTDFFFAYETTNVWASPSVTWKPRAVGHEETVSIGTLLAPGSGSNVLLSSVADVGGWDHKSITASPTVGMSTFFPWTPSTEWGNMTGAAIQESNPNFIARVGRAGWNGAGYAGYSLDGGTSYTKWTCPSGAAGGRIAVSANSETMVWVTQAGASWRSTNRGVNWTQITTLPSNMIIGGDVFSSGPRFPLAADKVNGNKFYVYHFGRVYVSTDAGATFTAQATLPDSYVTNNLTLETTPGIEGDIWLSMINTGLYHSTNSGASFTKINNVQTASFVAVGKASPGTPTVPAVYILGTVNNVANHVFRSNDNGATWTDLGVPAIGKSPFSMAADRNVYGRIYFGTQGNGIMVGDSGLNFSATDDSFVRDGSYAAANQAGTTAVTVDIKNDGSSYRREGYFKFDLSGYNGPITSASITLTPVSTATTGLQHQIALVTDNTWNEGAITWNNKPASTTILGTYVITAGTPIVIPVTAQALAAMSGDKTLSIRVYNTNPFNSLNSAGYASSENTTAAQQPILKITP